MDNACVGALFKRVRNLLHLLSDLDISLRSNVFVPIREDSKTPASTTLDLQYNNADACFIGICNTIHYTYRYNMPIRIILYLIRNRSTQKIFLTYGLSQVSALLTTGTANLNRRHSNLSSRGPSAYFFPLLIKKVDKHVGVSIKQTES